MFLNFRKHGEKHLNCLPYLISNVSSLCYTPRQSSKVSLLWCLHLSLRRNLIYCFTSWIYFTVCWSELKQVTLFSSSSCLFSSSVCWVKACLPRVSWEIRDSFSSSCRVSSPIEKTFIFLDRHMKCKTYEWEELPIWKVITRYNVVKWRESINFIPTSRKKLSKRNVVLTSKERGWTDHKFTHSFWLTVLLLVWFYGSLGGISMTATRRKFYHRSFVQITQWLIYYKIHRHSDSIFKYWAQDYYISYGNTPFSVCRRVFCMFRSLISRKCSSSLVLTSLNWSSRARHIFSRLLC